MIHGVSAGAGSVELHMTAYGGRDDGLFTGAIIESVFFPTEPLVEDREWQFERYAVALGCSSNETTDDPMYCLRGKTIDDLQSANVASAFPGRSNSPDFYWTPTIDGNLTEEAMYSLFEAGK